MARRSPRIENSGHRMQFGIPILQRSMLDKVYQFDKGSYVGEDGRQIENISRELFCDWWEEFPTGFLCALQDDEPVAVVGLFPVTEAWARQFLQRKVTEHELYRSIIKSALAEAGEATRAHWYFSGLSSKMEPRNLSSHLACLLGVALWKWLSFNTSMIGGRPIIMVAEGSTDNGERLLRDHFGFKLEAPATREREKPLFSLETSSAQIRNLLTHSGLFLRCVDLQREIQSSN